MSRALFLAVVWVLLPAAAAESFKTPVWMEGDPSGIEVTLDGKPATLRSIQGPDDPLILLIVMDAVKYPNRADAARNALVQELNSLGPNYLAGILSAQDGLAVRLDPSGKRELVAQTLSDIPVRGLPGLLDVVEQTSRIADDTLSAAPVRVAVLFITDGGIGDYRGDYTSTVVNPSDQRDLSRRFGDQLILERIRSIVDALQPAQAPLFFLHLARQDDDLNEVYQNGINEFADVTAGQALHAQSLQEIPPLVERLLDRIISHSVLTLEGACDGVQKLEMRGTGFTAQHRDRVGCRRPPS